MPQGIIRGIAISDAKVGAYADIIYTSGSDLAGEVEVANQLAADVFACGVAYELRVDGLAPIRLDPTRIIVHHPGYEPKHSTDGIRPHTDHVDTPNERAMRMAQPKLEPRTSWSQCIDTVHGERCVLTAGHPTGPWWPGIDGHMTQAMVDKQLPTPPALSGTSLEDQPPTDFDG